MYPTVALSYGKIVSRDYAVAVCQSVQRLAERTLI